MFTITKEFTFDAAHALTQLPEDHKCHHLHGHTYTVIVELQAEQLDSYGFVMDYGEFTFVKDYIDHNLDHRNLNDVLGSTTAERMAEYLFNIFDPSCPDLTAVTVKETPKTSATYRPTL